MEDILDEGIKLAVTITIIAVLLFWFLPVVLLPILSEISGSEILSPIFSYIVGVLLIIVAILFIVKK